MFYTKPLWDLLIVVLILLLFFGPKRLPALGRSLGEGMREFKDSITGKSKQSEDEQPQITAATTPPASGQPAEPATVSASPSQSESASEPRS